MTVQEFTATEENYYAGAINWNLLFSAELETAVLDREQARVYSLVYRPLFRDKIGAVFWVMARASNEGLQRFHREGPY